MKHGMRVWLVVPAAVATLAAVVALLLVLAGVFHDKVSPTALGGSAMGRGLAGGRTVEVVARELPQFEWAVGTVRAVHGNSC